MKIKRSGIVWTWAYLLSNGDARGDVRTDLCRLLWRIFVFTPAKLLILGIFASAVAALVFDNPFGSLMFLCVGVGIAAGLVVVISVGLFFQDEIYPAISEKVHGSALCPIIDIEDGQ